MNIGLGLIWALVVVGIIVLFILALRAMRTWTQTRSIIVDPVEGKCLVPLDTVPSVSGLPCCYVGGNVTSRRYLPTYDIVVGPTEVPYLQACQGFCTNGVTADGTQCVGGVGQTAMDQCINRARPRNCKGLAMPVAASGTTPFFTNAATNASCRDTRPC